MRTQVLNTLKSGINRLRIKGGADPSSLYDLLNGYVTIDGGVQSRPGTTEAATLPAGTIGLCAFNGGFLVFSATPVTGMPTGYTCVALPYPGDGTATLTKIHFAAPFLGHPYVVAEFSTGEIYHYWLLASGTNASVNTWQADHQYNVDAIVEPTTPNGYYYKIANNQFPDVWQPNQTYSVGNVVVPSTLNGWKYTVIEADGDNPSSGSTEPTFPASDGATVTEEQNEQPDATNPPAVRPIDPGGGRYGNPGGSGTGGNTNSRVSQL